MGREQVHCVLHQRKSIRYMQKNLIREILRISVRAISGNVMSSRRILQNTGCSSRCFFIHIGTKSSVSNLLSVFMKGHHIITSHCHLEVIENLKSFFQLAHQILKTTHSIWFFHIWMQPESPFYVLNNTNTISQDNHKVTSHYHLAVIENLKCFSQLAHQILKAAHSISVFHNGYSQNLFFYAGNNTNTISPDCSRSYRKKIDTQTACEHTIQFRGIQ